MSIEFPAGLAGGVMIADNAISPELCKELIDYVDAHPHLVEVGRTSSGVQLTTKKTFDCSISGDNIFATEEENLELSQLARKLFNEFGFVVREYCAHYPDLMNYWTNPNDTGYKFQRYLPNEGYFRPHCDGGTYHSFDSCLRVLGVVMYLNTVEEGGSTMFDLGGFECKAVEGRVLLFPSNFNFVHTGTVPISSRKDIISTFCISLWDK